MSEFLLFQLYAPLCSWGTTAVGAERPSDPHPGKSAIIGLLAAALGIRRHQETLLGAMSAGYKVAVRLDSPGTLLRDYQTVQAPPQVALKGHPSYSRRDEMKALWQYQRQHDVSGTILSFREYRSDAHYVIGIAAEADAPFGLVECADSLKRPKLPLYLGRKSCPPSLPLQPQVIEAPTLREALETATFTAPWEIAGNRPPEDLSEVPVYWEDGIASGIEVRETFVRNDMPISRQRWQFGPRVEHRGTITRGD
jgi:CRISPR system Cascade subunit CasD